MKRIALIIDIDEYDGGLSWALNDWRGQVSAGASRDSAENLAVLWASDIQHVLDESRYRGQRG